MCLDDNQKVLDKISANDACSFSYRELAVATKNFKESNLIGEGGFGKVYKGQLENGQKWPPNMDMVLGWTVVIATKRLNLDGLQGNQEFIVEVLMLSLLHHPNLVTLIGYCAEGEQRLLVYEYMPLGNLADHLFNYAMSGKLSTKADIFSFGVVLLELITGRKAFDVTKQRGCQSLVAACTPYLKDRRKYIELMDPRLRGQFPARSARHLIAVAAMCLYENPSERPHISEIVKALDFLAEECQSFGATSGHSPSSTAASAPSFSQAQHTV
ncbi:hypothetical protein Cgig2_018115 [Carnegiea gigantea]|uniref:Protein kinase domain-containing protein n=1 Tax=Carnegiea gigantea TaxID=171969 RepID=A0A9Q1JZA5_9CARY|nr:hypothetical protein Cgig2_018115 [Carnegiea gigantea]